MAKSKTKKSQATPQTRALVPEIMPAPVGRPSEYRPEYCAQLIKHMAQGLSFDSFAGEVSVSFQTLYTWREKHPEFLEAHSRGKSKCLAFHEKVARNIGMGVIPNAPKGAKATRGDARMQMFMLSVHGPQVYGGFLKRHEEDVTQERDAEIVFEYTDEKPPKKVEGEV